MKAAEDLYMRGYISYPRTETDRFNPEFDLRGMVGEQGPHPTWGGYARQLLDQELFNWPSDGGHDDQAHPPIHPTKLAQPNELGNEDEKKVYELVVRHFLACCSREARGDETKSTVVMGGEQFEAKGLVVRERTWYDVYPWERFQGLTLPVVLGTDGATFQPQSLMLQQSRTQPPPLLTEADLIAVSNSSSSSSSLPQTYLSDDH